MRIIKDLFFATRIEILCYFSLFSRGDWLLKFLYRTLSVAVDGVAGLQKIDLKNHKMHNVDLTDMVTGINHSFRNSLYYTSVI